MKFKTGKVVLALVCGAIFALFSHAETHAAEPVVMYKNAFCGCCDKWADHLRKAGFEVEVVSMANVAPLKTRMGIPENLWSCHTAKIGGYIIEGHVPVEDILQLLEEKPDVAGISVPGMPIGSPGMEMPGSVPDKFFSIVFTKDGEASVYAAH